MDTAQYGDTVTVHYTGLLDTGEVFADSQGEEPIELTIGDGQYIQGFEHGVVGMEVGETKTITIPPEEAFGTRRDELVVTVDREQFPEDTDPAVGQRFQVKQEGGAPLEVTIADLDEQTVTLDANHPLAGYTLTFNIHLVAVK
jgi:FKBP-type peptidyl-prolyl cis-trans isomerase 2